jgi:hypothetical protein
MLGGGPPRLYNEDQKGGYRDEHSPNRQLVEGPEFGGSNLAAYMPACERYAGRFFGQLSLMAPKFWRVLPPTVETVFVSALYGLVLWDEPIQNYDCHFADYTDDFRQSRVREVWGETLSDALIEFLRGQSRSDPITTVYDLLSESLYQSLFAWEKIQGAPVFHRIFKGIAGPNTLVALARVLARDISGFGAKTYTQGWHEFSDGGERLEFGLERKIGDDPIAMREGDVERIRNQLLKEQLWMNRLSEPLSEALVLAELSWRKVKDLPKYEWGGVAVSFVKPVERFLKDYFRLVGKETLGDVMASARADSAWRQMYVPLQQLNDLFIRAKHLEPPPITHRDVPGVRSLAFEILRFATQRNR